MRSFFYNLPNNIARCFRGPNLIWQLVACVLTYLFVTSGFDWWYFTMTRGTAIQAALAPAVYVGFFFPFVLPILLLFVGAVRKNKKILATGFATAQAGLLGLGLSSLYKVFTGRMGPHGFHNIGGVLTDISHGFRFGFYRGGAFQGWPSSHTATAFSMSFAIIALFPGTDTKSKIIRVVAFVYALYIGVGVSVNIHWFSDFVAGAILGTIIGLSVGKSFWKKLQGISK